MTLRRLRIAIIFTLAATVCALYLARAADLITMRDSLRPASKGAQTTAIPDDDDAGGPLYGTTFDGTNFPNQVTVNLRDTIIDPDGNSAFTIAELSDRTANTVVAIIRCSNKRGAALRKAEVQGIIFRPGDALQVTVHCNLGSAKEGDVISFFQAHVPDGALPGVRSAEAHLTSKQTATSLPKETRRPPYRFKPYGDLVYELTPSNLSVSDELEMGYWSTSLPHGRTQPANSETGYYGTLEMGAVISASDHVSLNTKRLSVPIDAEDGRPPYPFMASVLSGRDITETHFKYGAIEWQARMPSQHGTWPALWLLPKHGWPPEIDVYEGFSYNNEWTPSVGLSSSIHGGHNNKRTFKRNVWRLQLGDLGLDGDLTKQVHAFQARITPKWITVFVDDVETVRYANPFPHTTWYPIMTVAVRAKPEQPYHEGTTDMEIHALKIWKHE